MRKRKRVTPFFVLLFFFIFIAFVSIKMPQFLQVTSSTSEVRDETPKSSEPDKPKKIEIAGLPDHYILLYKDGLAELVKPDGTKTVITTPEPDEKVIPIPKPPAPKLEQLIVTEEGIVNVPKGAIITGIEKGSVTTYNPKDGSVIIYFANGRVETKTRKFK